MKHLHRYIFKELMALFGLSAGCLLGLILLGRMLQLRDLFLQHNLGILDLAQLFVYLSPYFLLLITPIATMLSVFLAFLRMSTDNELVALRASGVSLYRMTPAVIVFGLLCTAGTYFVSFYALSWGMDNFRAKLVEFARTKSKLAIQPSVFNQDVHNLTFYAQEANNENGELRFVFVEDATIKDSPVVIVAPQGRVTTDAHKGEVKINFKNGRIFRRNGEEINVLSFGDYSLRLPLAKMLEGIGLDANKPSSMSVSKLRSIVHDPDRFKRYQVPYLRKAAAELYKRYTLPAGCLVLGLFAMPMACIFRGMKQQYGLLLSMGLFLVYYSLVSLVSSMCETSDLSPTYVMWIPNALFLMATSLVLWMANREKSPQIITWISHLRFLRRRRAAA